MKDIFKLLADLAAEQAQLAAEGDRVRADGDIAAADDLIARAHRNQERVSSLKAMLEPIAELVNRKARRVQAAAKRRAH